MFDCFGEDWLLTFLWLYPWTLMVAKVTWFRSREKQNSMLVKNRYTSIFFFAFFFFFQGWTKGLLAHLKVFRNIHRFSLVITIKSCPCTFRPACELVPLIIAVLVAVPWSPSRSAKWLCAVLSGTMAGHWEAWRIFASQSCKCHDLCFYH